MCASMLLTESFFGNYFSLCMSFTTYTRNCATDVGSFELSTYLLRRFYNCLTPIARSSHQGRHRSTFCIAVALLLGNTMLPFHFVDVSSLRGITRIVVTGAPAGNGSHWKPAAPVIAAIRKLCRRLSKQTERIQYTPQLFFVAVLLGKTSLQHAHVWSNEISLGANGLHLLRRVYLLVQSAHFWLWNREWRP